MSFDDEVLSDNSCTVLCMMKPWVFSVGFTISCAALFCKLLRVNKLISNALVFVRKTITPKDVIAVGDQCDTGSAPLSHAVRNAGQQP